MDRIDQSVNRIVFDALLASKGLAISLLISKWGEILPKHLSINSFPLRLKSLPGKESYQLQIGVENNSIGMELSFLKNTLINKTNLILNENLISDVKILNREDLWYLVKK